MPSTLIRVPEATRDRIRALADREGRSVGDVVTLAIARFEEEAFWAAAEAADQKMRADPVASAAYDAEVAAWDGTLNDGLADRPWEG